MKNATEHAKKLSALLKRLRAPAEPAPPSDPNPIARLILGFLQWNATQRAAQLALQRLMVNLVDYNDLRVSHPSDIVALLGPRYPMVEERAGRLRDCLQMVYRREHATSLERLRERPKREVEDYLYSLPGITAYVCSYTLLWAFGGQSVPVDDKLADLLKGQKIVEPHSAVEEITAFLARYVPAEHARRAHLALQAWADKSARPTAAPKEIVPRRTAMEKKPTSHKPRANSR